MKIDPNDPLFVKRGIDPEVAYAQGFVMWTPEDYTDVIDTAFAAIIETQRGSVQWLRNKAREAGTGVIITRHSPVDVMGEGGVVRSLVPEIRPDKPVKSGMTKRHYHGPPVLPFAFLPTVVMQAHVRPDSGFVRSYRLKFKHVHEVLSVDEKHDHERIWHQPDLGEHGELDNDTVHVTVVPVRPHWHTLEVYPENIMSEHINQGIEEAGKKTWAHRGMNVNEIHFHTPMAKYLFAPSQKGEQSWNEQPHRHDRMEPEELAWHVSTFHTAPIPAEE